MSIRTWRYKRVRNCLRENALVLMDWRLCEYVPTFGMSASIYLRRFQCRRVHVLRPSTAIVYSSGDVDVSMMVSMPSCNWLDAHNLFRGVTSKCDGIHLFV